MWNYKSQLLDKRWKDKRIEILKRDNYSCYNCGETNKLQVHHEFYFKNAKAWEAPNETLTTLCSVCHKIQHSNLSELEKWLIDVIVKDNENSDANRRMSLRNVIIGMIEKRECKNG